MAANERAKPLSMTEWTASALRSRIADGELTPGTKLTEDKLSEELDVSRNTLREAFHLLVHERLLVHRPNRGVFVRTLTVEDVEDVYRLRCVIELAAVEEQLERPKNLADLKSAVAEAEHASTGADWLAMGTANLHFHQALTALAGSPRTDALMQQISAELRLAFHQVPDPRSFHEDYRRWNALILEQLEARDAAVAATLRNYLEGAMKKIIETFTTGAGEGTAANGR